MAPSLFFIWYTHWFYFILFLIIRAHIIWPKAHHIPLSRGHRSFKSNHRLRLFVWSWLDKLQCYHSLRHSDDFTSTFFPFLCYVQKHEYGRPLLCFDLLYYASYTKFCFVFFFVFVKVVIEIGKVIELFGRDDLISEKILAKQKLSWLSR